MVGESAVEHISLSKVTYVSWRANRQKRSERDKLTWRYKFYLYQIVHLWPIWYSYTSIRFKLSILLRRTRFRNQRDPSMLTRFNTSSDHFPCFSYNFTIYQQFLLPTCIAVHPCRETTQLCIRHRIFLYMHSGEMAHSFAMHFCVIYAMVVVLITRAATRVECQNEMLRGAQQGISHHVYWCVCEI